jgi:DNA mismatch repair protein MutS2
MLYPKNFEEKVGFNRIREMVINSCLCDLGKKRVVEMHFLTSADEIVTLLDQTDEFRKIITLGQDFPLDHFIDLTASLKKLQIEGSYLEADELFKIRRSQGTVRSILLFLSKKDDYDYPALRSLCKDIKVYPFVIDSIDKILNNKGEIKDNASAELKAIRRGLREKEKQVSSRLNQILKQAISDGIVEQGVSLAVRNARSVIPVNSSNKRQISGLVHDESASGKTSYIEPAEIVELNNDIRELGYAEKREIIRILVSVTDAIRPYSEDLVRSYNFLGNIDFIRAKALVAKKLNAIKPGISVDPGLDWIRAIHPLLYLAKEKEKKEVVPLDITLNNETRMLLISGPNAGGKSVCLQTVGLLQYMLQSGLLIPVQENSVFGIFRQLFIDIGDEQSIENDLSTYSSHLVNMRFYLKHANKNTLILIDSNCRKYSWTID